MTCFSRIFWNKRNKSINYIANFLKKGKQLLYQIRVIWIRFGGGNTFTRTPFIRLNETLTICYRLPIVMTLYVLYLNMKFEKNALFVKHFRIFHVFFIHKRKCEFDSCQFIFYSCPKSFSLAYYTEKTIFTFLFILNGIWSWWQFSFQFLTKWNSIWFKSKGKLSPRSYHIQYERKWKYSFLSVRYKIYFYYSCIVSSIFSLL